MKFITVLVTLFFLTACIDTSNKSTNGIETINPKEIYESHDEFRNGIDSLELIFYPDPKNQSIFSNIIVHDTLLINSLKSNLKQSSFATTECVHPFKIYLFGKGNVYKTIYLSDSCNYLAFVQNNNQKFIMLEMEVKQKVDSFKYLMGQMFD